MPSVPDVEAVRPRAAAPAYALPPGTRLREYEIRQLLAESACSVVYLGWDHALQRKVAIKEYLPAAIAGRLPGSMNVVVASEQHLDAVKAGLRGFLSEARALARFDHASLVKIYRFWEDNGTAYVVMPYYEGPSLLATLPELGHVPSEAELRAWLKPVLNAVTLLHDSGTWHQNIGPDEILLTPFGPVLLGFAGAAHAIHAHKHTPAAALKPGYAAIEQYGSASGTTRGPWTDLYALAAIVHFAITGEAPPPAPERLSDDRRRPLSVVAAGLYSERFLVAIDAAMAVQPRRRPADHAEFRALMGDIDAPEAVALTPPADLMQEPFAGAAAGESEVTIPDPPIAAAAPPAPSAVAAAGTPVAAPAPAPKARVRHDDEGDRAAPSWMQSARAQGLGKRALYGAIAGTCALIGIAALVLQFATRPAVRGPGVATAPTAPVVSASVPTRPLAATTTTTVNSMPPAAAPTTNAAASSVAPIATQRPAAVAAKPTASATTTSLAMTPEQTQAHCVEILQKASLEKITPAETEFFKRNCK